jgi:hypothetical protein
LDVNGGEFGPLETTQRPTHLGKRKKQLDFQEKGGEKENEKMVVNQFERDKRQNKRETFVETIKYRNGCHC